MRKTLILLVVMLSMLRPIGIEAQSSTIEVTVRIETFYADDEAEDGAECRLDGLIPRYAHWNAPAQIVIEDETHTVVGVIEIGRGTWTVDEGTKPLCGADMTATLPGDATFFTFVMDGEFTSTVSAAQLAEDGNTITFKYRAD